MKHGKWKTDLSKKLREKVKHAQILYSIWKLASRQGERQTDRLTDGQTDRLYLCCNFQVFRPIYFRRRSLATHRQKRGTRPWPLHRLPLLLPPGLSKRSEASGNPDTRPLCEKSKTAEIKLFPISFAAILALFRTKPRVDEANDVTAVTAKIKMTSYWEVLDRFQVNYFSNCVRLTLIRFAEQRWAAVVRAILYTWAKSSTSVAELKKRIPHFNRELVAQCCHSSQLKCVKRSFQHQTCND